MRARLIAGLAAAVIGMLGVAPVTAVDAAETMLAIARKKVAAEGLDDRITLDQADVKALPYPDGTFDTVYSNTILHHIPEPVAMLREAWRVLKRDGVLWIDFTSTC